MTTTHAITDIHETEDKAKKHIEETQKENVKKTQETREDEEKKLEEFMESERTEGRKQIEASKEEARKIMKEQLASGETAANSVINQAKGKSDAAVDYVIKTFLEFTGV